MLLYNTMCFTFHLEKGMLYKSYIFQKVEPRTHMVRGKVEAISISNEEVEIYVIDEDNGNQDIRVDVKTLRGEL